MFELKSRTVLIDEEILLKPQQHLKFHIISSELLTIKELSSLLDQMNKAINDVSRKQGVSNYSIGKNNASLVSGVEAGSIVIDAIMPFIEPVFLNMLSAFLYDRIVFFCTKNKKEKEPQKEGHYYGNPFNMYFTGSGNNITIINIDLNKSTIQDNEIPKPFYDLIKTLKES